MFFEATCEIVIATSKEHLDFTYNIINFAYLRIVHAIRRALSSETIDATLDDDFFRLRFRYRKLGTLRTANHGHERDKFDKGALIAQLNLKYVSD